MPSVNRLRGCASLRRIFSMNSSTSYRHASCSVAVISPYTGCSTVTSSTVQPQSTMAYSSWRVFPAECWHTTCRTMPSLVDIMYPREVDTICSPPARSRATSPTMTCRLTPKRPARAVALMGFFSPFKCVTIASRRSFAVIQMPPSKTVYVNRTAFYLSFCRLISGVALSLVLLAQIAVDQQTRQGENQCSAEYQSGKQVAPAAQRTAAYGGGQHRRQPPYGA